MRHAAAVPVVMLVLLAGVRAQNLDPVVTEGSVGAPTRAVWNAWTTADGLRSWLTPHVDVDLRQGGRIRMNYRDQEVLGDPGTIVYTILALEPQRMLSLQISGPPDNFPFPIAVRQMSTILYFLPVDDQLSRVRIISSGFGVDEESQRMREFFRMGDAIVLEQLQAHFRAVRQGLGR